MHSIQCLKNLILLLSFSSMCITAIHAACGRCMDNNVACVNSTHYRPCVNNNPLDSVLNCGEGKVCTNLLDHCQANKEPFCKDDEADCRSCDSDSKPLFVCNSRTTFQMCNPKDTQTVQCPPDTYCSYDSGKFCVKDCELPTGRYECDKPAA